MPCPLVAGRELRIQCCRAKTQTCCGALEWRSQASDVLSFSREAHLSAPTECRGAEASKTPRLLHFWCAAHVWPFTLLCVEPRARSPRRRVAICCKSRENGGCSSPRISMPPAKTRSLQGPASSSRSRMQSALRCGHSPWSRQSRRAVVSLVRVPPLQSDDALKLAKPNFVGSTLPCMKKPMPGPPSVNVGSVPVTIS